jgi:hypothetical protein
MGCKLVGTVKGTKIWPGGCAGASELRGAAVGNYRRQQAFFAGGLGQEVDRAGYDGSPHCPGPIAYFSRNCFELASSLPALRSNAPERFGIWQTRRPIPSSRGAFRTWQRDTKTMVSNIPPR